MNKIELTTEDIAQLKPFFSTDGLISIGAEGTVYLISDDLKKKISDNLNDQDNVIKIYNMWDMEEEIVKRKMFKRQQIVEYYSSLSDIDVVIIPRVPVFINDIFAGLSMRYLKDHCNLLCKINDYKDENYSDLSYVVETIKRLQDGVKYELHQRNIYTRDFSFPNIVFSNKKIYLIDADNYIIGAFELQTTNLNKMIQNDIYNIFIIFISLITKHYARFISLDNMNVILKNINLEKNLLDYFQSFLSQKEKFDYIDNSALDELSKNYIMVPNRKINRNKSEFILVKK